jgi:hypothetical protein
MIPGLKEALTQLLSRILDKDSDDSVWDRNSWNGDTEIGFYTTYELNMDKLNSEIDAFCESFKEQS